MYSNDDVCACIVSFNCEEIIIENVKSLLKQVKEVVIIDNGSNENSIKILRYLESQEKIKVIYNEENVGIAAALNQALEYTISLNKKLFLSMDQDSVLHDNAVCQLVTAINSDKSIVAAGATYQHDENKMQKVKYLITSGCLAVANVAKEVGGFEDSLFIDSVDMDFSLKLREKGQLVRQGNAKMKHKIGEKETGNLLGIKISYMGHSPIRYYYIYKNHIYIMRTYGKKHPFFCLKMTIVLVGDTFKLIFIEKDKRMKIKNAIKGLSDAFKI